MGMNIGSGGSSSDPDVMVEMNMTPLIDVMLVLIIMLIITIPIQHHSVNLDMPVSSPPTQADPPEVVKIDVAADGTVMWNGEVLADRRYLERRFFEISKMGTQPEIHLRPDRAVPYKNVAAVMSSAQRIGVTKIGIVGNEQYYN